MLTLQPLEIDAQWEFNKSSKTLNHISELNSESKYNFIVLI